MTTITIEDAQINLKDLIYRMGSGEEVMLTENHQPIARLVCEPISLETSRPGPGLGRGMITFIASDFNAPLDDLKEYLE